MNESNEQHEHDDGSAELRALHRRRGVLDVKRAALLINRASELLGSAADDAAIAEDGDLAAKLRNARRDLIAAKVDAGRAVSGPVVPIPRVPDDASGLTE